MRCNGFWASSEMTKSAKKSMLYLVKRSLRCKIFRKIGNRISLHLHGCGAPGETGGGGGVDTGGVIHEIGGKGRILDLGILQIPGELMDDGSDHLQVSQFFCTCIGTKMKPEHYFLECFEKFRRKQE